jgi:hypothetical protein
MQCAGIKTNGIQCSTMCIDGTRCKIHQASIHNYGPNTTRRRELKFIHNRNRDISFNDFRIHQIRPQFEAECRLEIIRYQTALHELETRIIEETQELGYDADRDAIERRNALQLRILQRRQQLRNERLEILAEQARHHIIQQQQLAAFAADNQNVHTTIIVEKVKRMVQKILEIPVPLEYQTDTLKTPGEIILECNLTKKAAWQMMSKYCEEVDIYELGIGIYPKILNSIWQYIKTSPHSDDLKKILKSEMQDNIGMCQQGNLSRLCNILSGYLDGLIVDDQSPREILAERLSTLQAQHPADMYIQARHLLEELMIPENEWEDWLEPLMEQT